MATYLLIFRLPLAKKIQVGKLGAFEFEGVYSYVGSDKRGTRVPRHFRKGKTKKWHIDYLTEEAEVLKAVVLDCDCEEELAGFLAERCGFIPNFGNSDCRDESHLFVGDASNFVFEFSNLKKINTRVVE